MQAVSLLWHGMIFLKIIQISEAVLVLSVCMYVCCSLLRTAMYSPVYLMTRVRCIGISVLYLSGPKNNMLIRVLKKI